MKGAKTALLALAVALLWRCGDRPGETLTWDEAEEIAFAGETRRGRTVDSPFRLPQAAGRTFRLALANPGESTVRASLRGAESTTIELPPRRWISASGRAAAGGLTLVWEGGPLQVAEPYFEPTKPDRRPNLLLISVDTLRADHFTPERMPETYRLFHERGAIFDKAYTTAPWTLPAHVSLLGGQYPQGHGVRLPDQRIPAGVDLLAEVLRDQGYYAAAVVEGNYIAALFGFAQGFHAYIENPPMMMAADPASVSKLAANLKTLRAVIEEQRDAPAFLFFHTYEVHCPYLPREGLEDEAGIGLTEWLLANDGKPLDQAVIEKLRQLYAAEVRYTDRLLAPLVKDLLDRGDWLVALVSDHGEELGEHGGLLHADALYEEAARVPFALAGPGVPAGRLAASPVSLVDVAPTLLARLGVPSPPSWQGRDSLAGDFEPTPLFAESFYFGPQVPAQDPRLTAIWSEDMKLLQTRNFGELAAELYHLGRDPGERENLQAREVQQRDALFLLIQAYLEGKGFRGERIGELTPEQREVMKTLGYIQ